MFDEDYTRPPQLNNLAISYYQHGYNAARMHLVIEVMPQKSGSLRVGVFFAEELFESHTIDYLTDKLHNILIKLSKGEHPENDLYLSSSLLGSYTKRDKDSIIDYFEEQVTKNPHKTALIQDQYNLTYLELYHLINNIARKLSLYRPLNRVLVYLPRGFDLLASYFALIRLKITFVPVDISLPLAWLSDVIDNSEPSLILSSHELNKKHHLNNFGLEVLEADNIEQMQAARLPINYENDIAYILFTSGSTGKPKGVCVSYKNINNLIDWAINKYTYNELSQVLFSTSVNFDLSIFEIFSALLVGGTLVVVQTPLSLIDNSLINISLVNLTPSTCKTLYEQNAIPSSVCTINLAGEVLDQTFVKKLYELGHIRKIYNLYGPTEATTYSTCKLLSHEGNITLGYPIDNTAIHVVNELNSEEEVAIGKKGQIAIAGAGLTLGYLDNQGENSSYIRNNLSPDYSSFLYLTGDYGYININKELCFIGRKDQQVKIRGHRVEMNHIRESILQYDNIYDVAITLKEDDESVYPKNLVVFIVLHNESGNNQNQYEFLFSLKKHLEEQIPWYMVPNYYRILSNLPKLISGKVDYHKLREIDVSPLVQHKNNINVSNNENIIAKAWSDVLGHHQFSADDNFFDVGGNSLLAAKLFSVLQKHLRSSNFRLVDVFIYPTISAFRSFLEESSYKTNNGYKTNKKHAFRDDEIAIIGLGLRLPEASDLEEYWDILENGKVVLKPLSDKVLSAMGVAASKLKNPNFIPISGVLQKILKFDDRLFGFTPNEARNTDPQQRIFLEVAWEALQNAGTIPGKTANSIGVFAGCGRNNYERRKEFSKDELVSKMQWQLTNDKDYFATKIAYKLNLDGPAINVNTACSTGLSALATACQYLRNDQVDIALAGASSLILPEDAGYIYTPDYIYSSSGTCSPFDENASGTVPSSGSVAVVLKKLSQAKADNDHILGIIKGVAVNNDANKKPGFTAPSAISQGRCLAEGLKNAGITPSKVQYIEAHGTGTKVGDPIEIEGIKSAYKGVMRCALGSVKANIGHTDTAAGLAGLAKVLAMFKYGKIVPQPNFNKLNEQISLPKGGEIYINDKMKSWATNSSTVYAGISAFGIGGTNTHIIVSNYTHKTDIESRVSKEEPAVILLSANSKEDILKMKQQLIHSIEVYKNKNNSLHRIGYTLLHHRFEYPHRFACVVYKPDEAISCLSQYQECIQMYGCKHRQLIKQWQAGEQVNAEEVYPKGSFKPLNLPFHPLDKKEYYVDPLSLSGESDPETAKRQIDTEDRQVSILNQLKEMYKELLGTSNIQKDDSFFELGGDSLLLLRLLAKIKALWNIDLNFDEFFYNDSVSLISQIIDQSIICRGYINLHCLYNIDNNCNTPVLIFIHPGNGALFQYQPLIKSLNISIKLIYGINNSMGAAEAKSLNRIEDYAKHYLKLIQAKLPNRKIVLIGWSFGGTVAYEMAYQVEHNKQINLAVDSVLLLDSWARYPSDFDQQNLYNDVIEKEGEDLLFPEKHSSLAELLKVRMEQLFKYEAKPLSTIPVKLFKAEEHNLSYDAQANYWEQYATNLSVIKILGGHNTLLNSKYLEPLGKKLSEAIMV